MKNKTSKGFTLIELLIVITIIGILAVAFLPSVLGAPAKARDVARKGHLNQIATAIEAYGLSGQPYPGTAGQKLCVSSAQMPTIVKYIAGGALPKDPSGTVVSGYSPPCNAGEYVFLRFATNSNNLNYALVAQVEDPANGNFGTGTSPTPPAATSASFTAAATGTYYVLVK